MSAAAPPGLPSGPGPGGLPGRWEGNLHVVRLIGAPPFQSSFLVWVPSDTRPRKAVFHFLLFPNFHFCATFYFPTYSTFPFPAFYLFTFLLFLPHGYTNSSIFSGGSKKTRIPRIPAPVSFFEWEAGFSLAGSWDRQKPAPVSFEREAVYFTSEVDVAGTGSGSEREIQKRSPGFSLDPLL